MDGKRSFNVIDSNDNTERKRVCIENKTNRSCFEDLSNELIYDILDYLDGSEGYEAFSNQNARFDRLINCQSYRLKLNFSLISKPTFERRCQEIIPSNIDRIISFHLSTELTINYFLQFFSINAFIRLESLILDQIESNKLEPLLINLFLLRSLFSLSIHVNSHFQNENNVYSLILRLPVIRYCHLKFPSGDQCTPLSIAINEQQYNKSIEHFIINGPCHAHQFIAILSRMPRIHIVRCHSLIAVDHMELNISISLLNLKYLFLQLNNFPFPQLRLLISRISPPLQSLGISIADNDDYICADNWIALISSIMHSLENFCLHYSNSISDDDDYDAFHSAIQDFESEFWRDRKWYFAHQHYSNQFSDGTDTDSLAIFYSIDPYRNHNYDLFEHVNNSECSGDTGRNLARCLTIYGHRAIVHCEVKFPNVTNLIISDEYMDEDRWPVLNINRIVLLEKLTNLVVECDHLCISALFKILNDGKCIRSLELARYEILDERFPFIEQVDDNNSISNRNNLVHLTIRSKSTVQQLHVLMNMFPHIKSLQLNLACTDYESIIKFLLLESRYLFSLCLNILDSNDEIVENFQTLIENEKLLIDYVIAYLNNKVHIWW